MILGHHSALLINFQQNWMNVCRKYDDVDAYGGGMPLGGTSYLRSSHSDGHLNREFVSMIVYLNKMS